MATSQFLLLPGELRNRIYSFCSETKAREVPRKPRSSIKTQRALFGIYGSLQYACRQTRAEFGPMYMASTVLKVHQPTLDGFLRTFYPHLKTLHAKGTDSYHIKVPKVPDFPLKGISGVQGNIHIKTYFGTQLDATLLMQLCLDSPAVKVTFMEASASLRLAHALNKLFANLSSGRFRPDFCRTFDRVWIICNAYPTITYSLQSGRTIDNIPVSDGVSDPRRILYHNGAPAMEDFAVTIQSDGIIRRSSPLS
jgi:hypothetical protein